MEITFTKNRLPYGWLGNMYPTPLQWNGVEWRTPEALFQALRFDEGEIREEIRLQRSPMGAKMVAKKHADKMTVAPMSTADVSLMEFVLRLKVDQHPNVKDDLLATGDAVIIEDVSNRPGGRNSFWGMSKASGEWVGDNTLGKLWMKIREELHAAARPSVGAAASGL